MSCDDDCPPTAVSSPRAHILCPFYSYPPTQSIIGLNVHQESSVSYPTQYPLVADPYPLLYDNVLLQMIQHRIIASSLCHSRNTNHENRLLQSLNNAPRCEDLLDSRDVMLSPVRPISVTSLDHSASSLSSSPPLHPRRDDGGSTSSNAPVLKRERDDPLMSSDGSFTIKGTEGNNCISPQTGTIGATTLSNILAAADASAPPKGRKKLVTEGMPRRPLTAYNLFFRDERAKILAGIEATATNRKDDIDSGEKEQLSQLSTEEFLKQRVPGSKRKRQRPHGKIGFRVLATMIGKRWRELKQVDSKRAEIYQEIAAKEKERYLKEMKEYKRKQEV